MKLTAASLIIYILVIVLLKEYINAKSIGPVFLFKVFIIVSGSWGIVHVFEKIVEHFSPGTSKRVIDIVKSGKIDYEMSN